MKRSFLILAGVLLAHAAWSAEPTKHPGYLLEAGRIVRPDAVRITGKQLQDFPLLHGDTPQQHYPPGAKKAGLGGVVMVDLLVNDMGQVLEAQVVSESPPGQDFGLAALDAAKTYEFRNPLQKLVLMTVKVEFKP